LGWLIDLLPLDYTDSVVLIGSVTIGITAGVLGAFAVFRQRSLVGDAISHATLPGVVIAFIATGAKDASSLAVGAALTGVVAAVLIVAIERTGRIRPDAAIGVVLSAFFSLGIVLLTYVANFNNANQAGLDQYLFGQAAGLLESDLNTMAVLCVLSVALVAIALRPLRSTLFDPQFSGSVGLPVRALELAMTAALVLAVIVGVRTVGAILMVSMLIVPAVTARQFCDRLGPLLVAAAVVGAAVGGTGAWISEQSSLPTGPVIVLTGVAVVLTAIAIAPGRGVVWNLRTLVRERRRRATESVLIDLEISLHAGPPPTEDELLMASGRSGAVLRRALRDLDRAGMLNRDREGRLFLTESGAAAAHTVLEQRDLWTAWLEHGWQLDLPDAREPDPQDLRGSLGDDAVERLLALEAAGQ
jgi:manganese/zinc/iron transport system permease protein